MARISVTIQQITNSKGETTSVGHDAKERDGFLIADLDKKQQLREHTVYPPGQERYIMPLDREALLDWLQSIVDTGTVTEAEMDAILEDTRGSGSSGATGNYTGQNAGDDISVSNVKTVLDAHSNISGTTDAEAEEFRDLISRKLTETGNFLLSYESGVISELRNQNWVKVFPNDASGTYTP